MKKKKKKKKKKNKYFLFIYRLVGGGGGGGGCCFFLPISKTALFKLNFLFVLISLVFEMETRPRRPAMLS